MKSPKLSVVALLSVVTVSSVFAGDFGGNFVDEITSSPVVDVVEPGHMSRLWNATKGYTSRAVNATKGYANSAVTRVNGTAANWPKTSAVIRGGAEGALAAGAVHGLYKAGQFGWNNRPNFLRGQDESVSTVETTEDQAWYQRHSKKLIAGATVLGATGIAAGIAKYRGTDLSAQPGAVYTALKGVGSYLTGQGSSAWNWVTSNKARLAGQATSAAVYAGAVNAIDCFKSAEETSSTEEATRTSVAREAAAREAAARPEAARQAAARPAAAAVAREAAARPEATRTSVAREAAAAVAREEAAREEAARSTTPVAPVAPVAPVVSEGVTITEPSVTIPVKSIDVRRVIRDILANSKQQKATKLSPEVLAYLKNNASSNKFAKQALHYYERGQRFAK